MAKQFKPADFSRVADFGHSESIPNAYTGVNVPTFVKDYSLHYTQQKRTLSQQYMIIGTQYEDTIVIITQHDARNETVSQARLKGETYSVRECSPDDSNDAIRYDYLTLRLAKKAGASGG